MNYFELFGLEVKFNLDTQNLAQVFQTLQKSAHPDRFANASSQEQLVAVQKSAMINDAYQTLKNPLKRAEYILKLRDTDMPNEQASFSDNAFLMRQMELREMLEEIRFSSDINAAVFEANQILEMEFEGLFKDMQIQLAKENQASNLAACEALRKLKFYQKLHVELDRLEDCLFD